MKREWPYQQQMEIELAERLLDELLDVIEGMAMKGIQNSRKKCRIPLK